MKTVPTPKIRRDMGEWQERVLNKWTQTGYDCISLGYQEKKDFENNLEKQLPGVRDPITGGVRK